jgi:hypothetical protein
MMSRSSFEPTTSMVDVLFYFLMKQGINEEIEKDGINDEFQEET